MAYVTLKEYSEIYNDGAQEAEFNRLLWEAARIMDNATTGVDNYRKLRNAFPTDEYDAETVRRCACNLINTMKQIEQAEKSAQSAQGFVEREDGTVVNKVISSVSSGSESISYATGSSAGGSTTINKAVSDRAERDAMYMGIIQEYLSGVSDANGVNLLYMGRYPMRR